MGFLNAPGVPNGTGRSDCRSTCGGSAIETAHSSINVFVDLFAMIQSVVCGVLVVPKSQAPVDGQVRFPGPGWVEDDGMGKSGPRGQPVACNPSSPSLTPR